MKFVRVWGYTIYDPSFRVCVCVCVCVSSLIDTSTQVIGHPLKTSICLALDIWAPHGHLQLRPCCEDLVGLNDCLDGGDMRCHFSRGSAQQ